MHPGRWICLAFLFASAGCAKDQDYFDVLNDQQTARMELTDILKTVKDEKSMQEAKRTLALKAEKYAAIAERAEALPSPPPKKVLERMQQDLSMANETILRLKTETDRIGRLPGGPEFLKRFGSSKGLLSAVQR